MSISVNKSPLAGREGKLLQSRVIRDRLFKELDRNVALKVSETDSADTYEGKKSWLNLRSSNARMASHRQYILNLFDKTSICVIQYAAVDSFT